MEKKNSIKLGSEKNGGYEIFLMEDGSNMKVFKKGQEDKSLSFQNLILSMFYRIKELEEELNRRKTRLERYCDLNDMLMGQLEQLEQEQEQREIDYLEQCYGYAEEIKTFDE